MRPQPPLRSTHATNNPRARLVYDRWGAYGRPVLLLHGLGFDRAMWWPAAADLTAAGSCTVIAPDLPGHGDSPRHDDHRLHRLAGRLADLVDSLGLRRAPVVVGHGASARLAAAFAADHATHHLITVDGLADADLTSDDGLAAVPSCYRGYARAGTDRGVLRVYDSWLGAGPGTSGPAGRLGTVHEPFAHLRDPHAFAARIRSLL